MKIETDNDQLSGGGQMNERFEIAGGWFVGGCVGADWYHVTQGPGGEVLHSTDDARFADWLARRLNGPSGSPNCACGKTNAAVWECAYTDTRRCMACHMTHQDSDEHKAEAEAYEKELSS